MARLVVLSFEDNEEADEFVAACANRNLFTLPEEALGGVNNDYEPSWPDKVEGMFAMPTQFCEGCSHKKRGWAKGKKYGWWVCAICGKPSKYNLERLYRNVIAVGVNLLEGASDRAATPFDDGWGSFRDQDIPAADRQRYGVRHQDA